MANERGASEGLSQRQRRQHIRQQLAEAGFGRRPLRVFGEEAVPPDEVPLSRLGEALGRLGPVFAAFASYLSSRPDQLVLADCLQLAAARRPAEPLPAVTVRRLLLEELGERYGRDAAAGDGETVIREVELEPFESRPLDQLHYAWLGNGEPVVVKLIRPDLPLDRDTELLELLEEALASRLAAPGHFHRLVNDFRQSLSSALDLPATLEALDSLEHDTRESQMLRVPKAYAEVCTKNVLVTQRLAGTRMDRFLQQCRQERERGGPFDDPTSIDGIIPDELARLLCDVWLHETFQGSQVPVDLRPENVLIRSSSEIAIVDGNFAVLPSATKRNLLDYFIGVATDEPGKSLLSLLKECDASRRTMSEHNLDRRFRQLVAFREGGWEDGGRTNCLSDTVFAQWRLASRCGYLPLRHLQHVYRGTFHISLLARGLAPGRDSLLEGVKDLRMTKLLIDMRSMLEPSYWGGQMDRLASLMILGPKHLDEALSTAAEPPGDPQRVTDGQPPAQWPIYTLLTVLLAALLLILAWPQQAVAWMVAWSEQIKAVAFLLAGGLMLRLLTRRPPDR